MDFQRYLLIAAIAVLSFMLLTEWVQFKEQKSDAIVSLQQTAGPAIANTGYSTGAAAVATDSSAVFDDLPTSLPGAVATVDSAVNAALLSPTVRVSTDSLVLDINTLGGDIVRSALPRHFAKIDSPEIPFTLLEQSNIRTYIAQSGLIGTNGIDTSKGRAQYSSSSSSYRLEEGRDKLVVDLVHNAANDVQIIKRFSFYRG
jgi:YidC/Oxa1 family membrane protein insertase